MTSTRQQATVGRSEARGELLPLPKSLFAHDRLAGGTVVHDTNLFRNEHYLERSIGALLIAWFLAVYSQVLFPIFVSAVEVGRKSLVTGKWKPAYFRKIAGMVEFAVTPPRSIPIKVIGSNSLSNSPATKTPRSEARAAVKPFNVLLGGVEPESKPDSAGPEVTLEMEYRLRILKDAGIAESHIGRVSFALRMCPDVLLETLVKDMSKRGLYTGNPETLIATALPFIQKLTEDGLYYALLELVSEITEKATREQRENDFSYRYQQFAIAFHHSDPKPRWLKPWSEALDRSFAEQGVKVAQIHDGPKMPSRDLYLKYIHVFKFTPLEMDRLVKEKGFTVPDRNAEDIAADYARDLGLQAEDLGRNILENWKILHVTPAKLKSALGLTERNELLWNLPIAVSLVFDSGYKTVRKNAKKIVPILRKHGVAPEHMPLALRTLGGVQPVILELIVDKLKDQIPFLEFDPLLRLYNEVLEIFRELESTLLEMVKRYGYIPDDKREVIGSVIELAIGNGKNVTIPELRGKVRGKLRSMIKEKSQDFPPGASDDDQLINVLYQTVATAYKPVLIVTGTGEDSPVPVEALNIESFFMMLIRLSRSEAMKRFEEVVGPLMTHAVNELWEEKQKATEDQLKEHVREMIRSKVKQSASIISAEASNTAIDELYAGLAARYALSAMLEPKLPATLDECYKMLKGLFREDAIKQLEPMISEAISKEFVAWWAEKMDPQGHVDAPRLLRDRFAVELLQKKIDAVPASSDKKPIKQVAVTAQGMVDLLGVSAATLLRDDQFIYAFRFLAGLKPKQKSALSRKSAILKETGAPEEDIVMGLQSLLAAENLLLLEVLALELKQLLAKGAYIAILKSKQRQPYRELARLYQLLEKSLDDRMDQILSDVDRIYRADRSKLKEKKTGIFTRLILSNLEVLRESNGENISQLNRGISKHERQVAKYVVPEDIKDRLQRLMTFWRGESEPLTLIKVFFDVNQQFLDYVLDVMETKRRVFTSPSQIIRLVAMINAKVRISKDAGVAIIIKQNPKTWKQKISRSVHAAISEAKLPVHRRKVDNVSLPPEVLLADVQALGQLLVNAGMTPEKATSAFTSVSDLSPDLLAYVIWFASTLDDGRGRVFTTGNQIKKVIDELKEFAATEEGGQFKSFVSLRAKHQDSWKQVLAEKYNLGAMIMSHSYPRSEARAKSKAGSKEAVEETSTPRLPVAADARYRALSAELRPPANALFLMDFFRLEGDSPQNVEMAGRIFTGTPFEVVSFAKGIKIGYRSDAETMGQTSTVALNFGGVGRFLKSRVTPAIWMQFNDGIDHGRGLHGTDVETFDIRMHYTGTEGRDPEFFELDRGMVNGDFYFVPENPAAGNAQRQFYIQVRGWDFGSRGAADGSAVATATDVAKLKSSEGISVRYFADGMVMESEFLKLVFFQFPDTRDKGLQLAQFQKPVKQRARSEARGSAGDQLVMLPVFHEMLSQQTLSAAAFKVMQVFRDGILPLSLAAAAVLKYVAQTFQSKKIRFSAKISAALHRFPQLEKWTGSGPRMDEPERILDLREGASPDPADLLLTVSYLMKHSAAQYHLFVIASPEETKAFMQKLEAFLGFDPLAAFGSRFSVKSATEASALRRLLASAMNARQVPTVVLGADTDLKRFPRSANLALVGLHGSKLREVAPVLAAIQIHKLVEIALRLRRILGKAELLSSDFSADLALQISALKKLLSAA